MAILKPYLNAYLTKISICEYNHLNQISQCCDTLWGG